jgi:hypothetical protein
MKHSLLLAMFCMTALISISLFATISQVNLDAGFVYGKF